MGGDGALLATKNKKVHISVVPNTPVIDPTEAEIASPVDF